MANCDRQSLGYGHNQLTYYITITQPWCLYLNGWILLPAYSSIASECLHKVKADSFGASLNHPGSKYPDIEICCKAWFWGGRCIIPLGTCSALSFRLLLGKGWKR